MNNIEFFFYIKEDNINIAIFDGETKKIIFNKKIELSISFDDIEVVIDELNNILKKLIIEIEGKVNQQINRINLIIEDPYTLKINACIKKNFDKLIISKGQIEYLVQDLKQQIINEGANTKVNHIIINEFIVDGQKVNNPPIDKVCNDLIIDLQFICLRKDLVTSLENLFKNHQIEFSSVLCAYYTKSFFNQQFNSIFETAVALKKGYNPNEVVIIPKKPVKMGFFEKLFHIFS